MAGGLIRAARPTVSTLMPKNTATSSTAMTAPSRPFSPPSPADSATITNYYKQSVYNPDNTKIGDVDDVLVDKSGKVTALVIGVGGFLGMGTKDVIIPFSDVTLNHRNNSNELTVNETKDTLKAAKGFSYDRNSTTWKPT